MRLTATCVFGTESVLAEELKNLSFSDVRSENGRVNFNGTKEAIPKANIWLRSAERVYIEAADFHAGDFNELFEHAHSVEWSEFIPGEGRYPVNVTCINSALHSVPDCQKIIKKAISRKLGEAYSLERLPETGDVYAISAFIYKDRCRLYLDTTGVGLHKRGYRRYNVTAPISETLAASLIGISYWNRSKPFLDPFCGSGTFVIEAAMMAKNIAPGRNRPFDSCKWPFIGETVWKKHYEEAYDLETDHPVGLLSGSDIDGNALEYCALHAQAAAVDDVVSFRRCDVKDIQKTKDYGVIICNPPYGKRLLGHADVTDLYREMGKKFSEYDTWSKYIITDYPGFEQVFGTNADKKRKIYNGMILCNFYQYFGPNPRERIFPLDTPL
ncbi:MAG: class I SAM-dependent RNA methyltransferase [Clostridia bacterium]